MFRATIHFRSGNDTNNFEIANVFELLVDGVQTQPKDLKFANAQNITLNYHQRLFGNNPKKLSGTVVFNASDIIYIDLVGED